MDNLDLESFRTLRIALEEKSLEDNANLLTQIGQYYVQTMPSEIDLDYVTETEYFLNTLYLKSEKEYIPAEIHTSLKSALGIASWINFVRKLKIFNPLTFSSLKDLGETMISISRGISEYYNSSSS